MIKQKFDILNKPVLSCDNVAYLVDYKNVELHRQYVGKYYVTGFLQAFFLDKNGATPQAPNTNRRIHELIFEKTK